MKMFPLNDKVIIERDKRDVQTPGGIIIPETAEQRVTRGTVIAVGRGRITEQGKLLEPQVKAGDKVIFEFYAGQTVELDGKEYLVVKEGNIAGVVDS